VLSAPNCKDESFPFEIDSLKAQKSPALADIISPTVTPSIAEGIKLAQPRPGQNFGYLLITGNPDGTRADVSINQPFKLVLPVQAQEAAR
jgi:hypothetical protein